MIDLTQLASSLQGTDFPAFRNLASANELFRETYESAMSATSDYISSYTAVQTFDNSGTEVTDQTRKRNALGTVFKSLKNVADRYNTIVSTATSVPFTLSTTPGLAFADLQQNVSLCLYFEGNRLSLDTEGSMLRSHPASIYGNFYTNIEFNARRSENINPGLDASGWAMATQFFEYSINAINGAVLQYPRKIIIILRARGDISTTSGAFVFRVCVEGKSSSPFMWESSEVQCIGTNRIENTFNALTILVKEFNKHIDGMLVYAPGSLGDFWTPVGNCTITYNTSIGLVSVNDSTFTWDLNLQMSQTVLPGDTTMLKDAKAREGLIHSFMNWAMSQ